MTVVLEDQVKTITADIDEEFGDFGGLVFDSNIDIEDVVRAVIAQYDISGIARLEAPPQWTHGVGWSLAIPEIDPPLIDEERARDDQNRNVI